MFYMTKASIVPTLPYRWPDKLAVMALLRMLEAANAEERVNNHVPFLA
jgi:hypothetical protein